MMKLDDLLKDVTPTRAAKAYAALVVILVWALARALGLEVPEEVASALVVVAVWAVPNASEDELP